MSKQTGKVLVCNKCGRIIPEGCGMKHEAGETCGAKLGDGGEVPASGTCDGTLIFRRPGYKALIEQYSRLPVTKRDRVRLNDMQIQSIADAPRMVCLTEEDHLKLLRESGRGRALACYILGRTEDLKTYGDCRDALAAVREKCNEEVAHV